MNSRSLILSAEESDEQPDVSTAIAEDDDDVLIVPESLSILALRNTVLFPGVMLPITIGRDASVKLVRDAAKGDKLLGVISQREQKTDEPNPEDLYEVGTIAKILKLLKMPDGSKSVILQGRERFKVKEFTQ